MRDRCCSRRTLAASAWSALLAVYCGSAVLPAYGQAYPVRPVRLIIPFPPGGSTNTVGRTFAAKFTEFWGEQVVVDNRAGGNTIVGAELAAKAAPDGYTLFLTTAATMVNNVLLYRKLPYDARKWVFRLIVTGCFGVVTDRFGIVTGDSGGS